MMNNRKNNPPLAATLGSDSVNGDFFLSPVTHDLLKFNFDVHIIAIIHSQQEAMDDPLFVIMNSNKGEKGTISSGEKKVPPSLTLNTDAVGDIFAGGL